MPDVLPEPPGLDIDTVIYNYTIRKETEDHVDVYVGNENADGTGYIFREHDEWRPGSLDGTEINKVVGVGGIHRDLWGDGSIEVQGNGSVEDPSLIYTYRVDPCYDPQFDPNCPGYVQPVVEITEIDLSQIYDATKDENIDLEREVAVEQNEENLDENEKKKKEEEEELKRKYRLEKAMSTTDAAALFAENQRIQQMNQIADVNLTSYSALSLPGGTYKESVQLVDTQLPNSQRGLRNGLAQQLLHQQMVDMQYKIGE
jgi:hypothetical protein